MPTYIASRAIVVRPQRHAAIRKRVDLLHDEEDFTVALLGAMGFSNKAIMARTNLSQHQITYRLHKGGVKRMDYRNGESRIAQAIFRRNADIAEPILRRELSQRLLENGEL
jgi:hypothetical protein